MTSRLALLCALVLALVPGRALAKRMAADEVLPVAQGPSQAVRELVAAFKADDLASFDKLAKTPTPPMIRVVGILLNPPSRTPTELEYAVIDRIVAQAPASSGVANYVAYWRAASDEIRAAERARWGLSARFFTKIQAGEHQLALDVIEPELAGLYDAPQSEQAATILFTYCDLLLTMGRFSDAEQELRKLLAKLQAEQRRHEMVRLYDYLAMALEAQSPVSEESAKALQEGQKLAEQLGLWSQAARFAIFQGSAAMLVGDTDRAQDLMQRGQASAEAAGDSVVARTARMALAELALARGELDIVREQTRRVLKGALAEGDLTRAAHAVITRANLDLSHGSLAAALANETWLEDNAPRIGDHTIRGQAYSMLGYLALWRGDADAARTRFLAAYENSKHIAAAQRTVVNYLSALLKHNLLSPEQRTEILPLYRARIEIESQGTLAPWVLAEAAHVEQLLGNHENAEAYAERALVFGRAAKRDGARTQAAFAMAQILRQAGKVEAAHAHYEEAVAAANESSPLALECHGLIGRCLLDLGRPREALDVIRRTLATSPALRTGLTPSSALLVRSREHRLAVLGMEAACALAKSDPSAADEAAAAAWWLRESGTGRLLAESIGASPGTARLAHGEELAAAMDAVESSQRKLVVSIARGEVERQASLREGLNGQYATLRKVSRRADKRRSNPTASQWGDLRALQDALGPDEGVLAYTVGQSSVYGIAIDKNGAQLARLGDARAVADLTSRWKTLAATDDGPDQKLAARLYDKLVRPIEGTLAERSKWTVLPEGPLANVPVDAWIRTPANGSAAGGQRLIERHVIAYSHSAGVRAALRARAATREPARGVIALGDPVYPTPKNALPENAPILARLRGGLSLPRLVASGNEATRVAALYPEEERTTLLGEQATRKGLILALRERKGPLRSLHLACHGIVDDELPTLSGLVFTGGDVLTAERLSALKVEADLAVLSACDSGAGKKAVGEGVLGLTRSFFLSGVSQVICSTWQVADTNTSTLMVRFHEGREQRSLSAAAALREARLSLLRNKATSHPFYWAGLQLWGSGAK